MYVTVTRGFPVCAFASAAIYVSVACRHAREATAIVAAYPAVINRDKP